MEQLTAKSRRTRLMSIRSPYANILTGIDLLSSDPNTPELLAERLPLLRRCVAAIYRKISDALNSRRMPFSIDESSSSQILNRLSHQISSEHDQLEVMIAELEALAQINIPLDGKVKQLYRILVGSTRLFFKEINSSLKLQPAI